MTLITAEVSTLRRGETVFFFTAVNDCIDDSHILAAEEHSARLQIVNPVDPNLDFSSLSFVVG